MPSENRLTRFVMFVILNFVIVVLFLITYLGLWSPVLWALGYSWRDDRGVG
jgi:hypothetical protein